MRPRTDLDVVAKIIISDPIGNRTLVFQPIADTD
jgi:hypothetical protein